MPQTPAQKAEAIRRARKEAQEGRAEADKQGARRISDGEDPAFVRAQITTAKDNIDAALEIAIREINRL